MEYTVLPCEEKDREKILEGLIAYNLSKVPGTQTKSGIDLSKKIQDKEGNIIAGIVAKMYEWNCVYVEYFWIDEAYRKQGLGSRLLKEMEQEAQKQGAELIHLDTFDFQAKDFYLRNGYEVFGILDQCPKGHKRYYMKKAMTEL